MLYDRDDVGDSDVSEFRLVAHGIIGAVPRKPCVYGVKAVVDRSAVVRQ